MTLPANVGFCTITGRYISASVDGTDDGRDPDGVPLVGLTVTFTPSLNPPIIKDVTAVPPVSIQVHPVVARTDADGDLVGSDGVPGVRLVASDYPDPAHPWTYTVSITGQRFPGGSFQIVAPSGGVIDLTSVLEAPGGAGFDLSAWAALVAQATTARDEATTARDEAVAAGVDVGAQVEALTPPIVTAEVESQLPTAIASAVPPAVTGEVAAKVAPAVTAAVNAADIPGKVATAIAAQAGKVVVGGGAPNGVVTANPGTLYIDTASTLGVWAWFKATGTGNMDWRVLYGDTLPRDVLSLVLNGWTAGICRIRREGSTVHLYVYMLNPSAATADMILAIPAGFKPSAHGGGNLARPVQLTSSAVTFATVSLSAASVSFVRTVGNIAPGTLSEITWETLDAWPTTLPGNPA